MGTAAARRDADREARTAKLHLHEGERRALALGGRGPIRFDERG